MSDKGYDVGVGSKFNGIFYREERMKDLAAGITDLFPHLQLSATLVATGQPSATNPEPVHTADSLVTAPAQAATAQLQAGTMQVEAEEHDQRSFSEVDMESEWDSEVGDASFLKQQDDSDSDYDDDLIEMDPAFDSEPEDPSFLFDECGDLQPQALKEVQEARTERLMKKILQDLDAWCENGCLGSRTRYLKGLDISKVSFTCLWLHIKSSNPLARLLS
jgi:hypothetical protein